MGTLTRINGASFPVIPNVDSGSYQRWEPEPGPERLEANLVSVLLLDQIFQSAMMEGKVNPYYIAFPPKLAIYQN
jgi:hypothetical protein